jgi:hypothetical protein
VIDAYMRRYARAAWEQGEAETIARVAHRKFKGMLRNQLADKSLRTAASSVDRNMASELCPGDPRGHGRRRAPRARCRRTKSLASPASNVSFWQACMNRDPTFPGFEQGQTSSGTLPRRMPQVSDALQKRGTRGKLWWAGQQPPRRAVDWLVDLHKTPLDTAGSCWEPGYG